ncbi:MULTISPECIES: MFS transporter [unclassified Achromobacter]|uniref:MFS transporter n=1 Tax=unclassified Achromobacter TaxID=2626865 RepID=UPI001303A6DE|nr:MULTISPECIES: MFS transporter [unclassified Achromobacter]
MQGSYAGPGPAEGVNNGGGELAGVRHAALGHAGSGHASREPASLEHAGTGRVGGAHEGRGAAEVRRGMLRVGAASLGLSGGYTALFAGTAGVFLLPVATALGTGRGVAATCMALASLGLAVSSPLAGRLMDRYGHLRVIGWSIVLFALGLLAMSTGPLTPYAVGTKTFLIGLLGVATSPVGYLSILAHSFERRVGLAFGIASIGAGIGAALAPLFAGWVTRHQGWQTAYALLAGVALVLGFLAIRLLRGIDDETSPARPAAVSPTPHVAGDTAAQAFGNWRFWLMGLCVALVAAVGLGAIVHVPALLSDNGVSPEMAAAGGAFAAVGLTAGRFLAGVLLDIAPARVLAAGAFLLGACGVAILGTSSADTPYWQLALGAGLTAMLIGAEGDLVPFLVKRYFGLKSFGAVYGCLISLFCLGTLAGPILLGVAFDRFHGYGYAMAVSGVVCVACSLLILAVGPYRYPHTS